MVVRVFDKTKSIMEPQYEATLFKMIRPDGSYVIDVGPIAIVMDAADKIRLFDEWTLLERLFSEWKAQGKTVDLADESFQEFLAAGHNR